MALKKFSVIHEDPDGEGELALHHVLAEDADAAAAAALEGKQIPDLIVLKGHVWDLFER